MVRVTKFNKTNLSDALFNETSLFWDTSNPSSGLPANAFFLNTTENTLLQNTGTEGTPVWTLRSGIAQGTAFPTTSLTHGQLFNKTNEDIPLHDFHNGTTASIIPSIDR